MAHYYLYLLDHEGHIKAREILTSADDEDAVTRAQIYLRDHASVPAIELWLEERRVKTLKQTAAA